jgi:hypothetical protein
MMSDSFMIRSSSPSSVTSVPDRNDLTLRRLFLGSVGDDDPTLGFILGVDTLHDHAVVQGAKLGFGH